MIRKFSVIFGAEKADRLSPFNDDKSKAGKICRHKALRVQLSVAYPTASSPKTAQAADFKQKLPWSAKVNAFTTTFKAERAWLFGTIFSKGHELCSVFRAG